jgi:hypothetical protein
MMFFHVFLGKFSQCYVRKSKWTKSHGFQASEPTHEAGAESKATFPFKLRSEKPPCKKQVNHR